NFSSSTRAVHGPHLYSIRFSRLRYFIFNDASTPEIYTLSLHDALPILPVDMPRGQVVRCRAVGRGRDLDPGPHGITDLIDVLPEDRKSTRLNSSHVKISYAVFCLKKKNKIRTCHLYETLQYSEKMTAGH